MGNIKPHIFHCATRKKMTARKSTKEKIWSQPPGAKGWPHLLPRCLIFHSTGLCLASGECELCGSRVNLVQRKDACTQTVPQGCSLALSNHMAEAESKVADLLWLCVGCACRSVLVWDSSVSAAMRTPALEIVDWNSTESESEGFFLSRNVSFSPVFRTENSFE